MAVCHLKYQVEHMACFSVFVVPPVPWQGDIFISPEEIALYMLKHVYVS